jgi:hypothetical protein
MLTHCKGSRQESWHFLNCTNLETKVSLPISLYYILRVVRKELSKWGLCQHFKIFLTSLKWGEYMLEVTRSSKALQTSETVQSSANAECLWSRKVVCMSCALNFHSYSDKNVNEWLAICTLLYSLGFYLIFLLLEKGNVWDHLSVALYIPFAFLCSCYLLDHFVFCVSVFQ